MSYKISGQEDDTIDFDEGVRITPFNMKEELEEGHFDTEGMYIFQKDKVLYQTVKWNKWLTTYYV